MPSRKITATKPATSAVIPANAAPKAAKRVIVGKQANKPASVPAVAADATAAPEPKTDMRSIAHSAAAAAVAEFYSGASKPFKAAGDRFKPLNFDNAKSPTPRQAALLLAMLTYSAGNIKRDGTFTRGKFSVPASLIFDAKQLAANNLKASDMLGAQPESGCIGNMLGRAVTYVSGPKAGSEQRDAVYKLNAATVRSEIRATFGDKHNALINTILA
jgi:hypothetical protein